MQGMWNWVRLVAFAIAAVLAVPAAAQDAGAVDREVRARVAALRALQPGADPARLEANTRQMDDNWKYFDSNRAKALPVLRSELAAEVAKPDRNNLVLLGLGFYLYTHGDRADSEPARAAAFAIDPAAPIIAQNLEQYFYFVHAIAAEHDARVLPLIDKAFLDRRVSLVIPEYALNLDEGLVCMLLYGAYGYGAEAHLQPFLKDPARVRKTIEILVWLGTPASNAGVLDAMMSARNIEVFARGTAFLMQSGGPEGRRMMLDLDASQLDPQSAEALAKSRSHIEAISGAWYKSVFDRLPGAAAVPDAELRKRLAATAAGKARDESLSPRAIYASGVAREELIENLTLSRNVMLQELYDQVLQDVRTTDMVINGLRFRDH